MKLNNASEIILIQINFAELYFIACHPYVWCKTCEDRKTQESAQNIHQRSVFVKCKIQINSLSGRNHWLNLQKNTLGGETPNNEKNDDLLHIACFRFAIAFQELKYGVVITIQIERCVLGV